MNATIAFTGLSLLAAIFVAIFFILSKEHGFDENSTFHGTIIVSQGQESKDEEFKPL